ncbi:MAG: FIST N-terminal domain-containing protein [Pelobacteraceae bacterium]
MAGKVREMIDFVLRQRAAGNPMLEKIIKTKMILKGINPGKFTHQSDDDPEVLQQLEGMAMELGYLCREASAPEAGDSDATSAAAPEKKIQRMDIISAHSTKDTIDEITKDLREQLVLFDAKLLLFFASSKFAPDEISRKMQDSFPSSLVFGCSTAGELATGTMLDDSVVVMGFNDDSLLDAKIEIIEDLKDQGGVKKAFDAFAGHFGEAVADMASREYVGIILVDGLSGAEENLIETIGDSTNVVFIGGSAGDDLKFNATHLYANGKTYRNAAIVALLKPGAEFAFVKTQSFRNLGTCLEVTKADEASRTVLEFNGKPAAIAYAEAINSSVEEASHRFMHNPVGLVIDDEPFVRSPQQIKDNGSMAFYCAVREGMELSLLESTDIIEDTRAAIGRAREESGRIYGIINFNCILRTLELKQKNLTREYGDLFSAVPTAGFSTYGEQYIGHINQTATMLVFK